MTEGEFWGRPYQAPIQPDNPMLVLAKAKIVRDAMQVLFNEAADAGRGDEALAWDAAINFSTPASLAKLARLIR